jgi:uncharacterized protein (TIGR04141 family)
MTAITLFKIKEEFSDPDQILVDRSKLGYSNVKIGSTRIGDLYVKRVERTRPSWLKFFGNSIDLSGVSVKTASLAAVFLTKRRDSLFAIAFGYGRTLLKDGVTVDRFGLRATLNAIEPSQLRSIDHKRLETVPRHTREQLSRGGSLDQFGLDVDRDLLRAVTGAPIDAKYGRRLSGADQLTALADITLESLGKYIEMYDELSAGTAYTENFPWVDNVREVRDPALEAALDKQLLKDLKRSTAEFWLAPPEIIDWAVTEGFRYKTRKGAIVYRDLDLDNYFAEYGSSEELTEGRLQQDRIYHVRSDDVNHNHSWSFVRCLVGECEYKKRRFVLNEGKWYAIESEFLTSVEEFINGIPATEIDLPRYSDASEGAYNKRVAKKNASYLALLDQNFIKYPQHGKVEVCDLYTMDRKFVHVKRSGASSTLSHLFNQGTVSADLMVHEPGFRRQFQEKLPLNYRWGNPDDGIDPKQFEVCYAIVSRPSQELKLPFFSKISLRAAVKNLQQMGFRVSVKAIPS